jgi:type VI secretion system protein ImpH
LASWEEGRKKQPKRRWIRKEKDKEYFLYWCKPRFIGKSRYAKSPRLAAFDKASWAKDWQKRDRKRKYFPDRLNVHFFGLFGPNGPLPLHLTEYALSRAGERDHTLTRFADLFHHRLLCLFYRAWAESQPVVHYDRSRVAFRPPSHAPDGSSVPDPPSALKDALHEDRFSRYLGSLFGLGLDSLRERDAMPDRAKLLFAGLLSCQTRHADGLKIIIAEFFGVPAQIQEFVGEWMDIAPHEQTRLGMHEQAGHLGLSTVLGERVFGCQHKIRIVLGPLDLAFYRAMLPGEYGLVELAAILRNYIGDEFAWDVNLVLRQTEIPPLKLDGGAQLGWTSWLGEKNGDAEDVILNSSKTDLV